jgi:hypothetical protein
MLAVHSPKLKFEPVEVQLINGERCEEHVNADNQQAANWRHVQSGHRHVDDPSEQVGQQEEGQAVVVDGGENGGHVDVSVAQHSERRRNNVHEEEESQHRGAIAQDPADVAQIGHSSGRGCAQQRNQPHGGAQRRHGGQTVDRFVPWFCVQPLAQRHSCEMQANVAQQGANSLSENIFC